MSMESDFFHTAFEQASQLYFKAMCEGSLSKATAIVKLILEIEKGRIALCPPADQKEKQDG